MARKKTGDNKGAAKIFDGAGRVVNTPSAQAENISIAAGRIKLRGDVSENIAIDHGYPVEQISILLTQITAIFQSIVQKNGWSYRRRSIPTKTPYNEVLRKVSV